ncbi:MAG: hypothetical protein MPW15_01985 [Candidatus Manganitrophus sp.]|nr:hypothetical protein [Candidatus Manganitrophus sp.]
MGSRRDFIASPPPNHRYIQTLWNWMNVRDLNVPVALRLDPLSLTMIGVVTFVGFLIHLFAAGYMRP